MTRKWMVGCVAATIAAVGLVPVSCKQRSRAEKDLMARLAGTWVWRQPKSTTPSIVVLELSARGRYQETSYREVDGKRRLLYIKRFTAEVAPEPDGAEAIAKLKKAGFEPAIETGRYTVSIQDKLQTMIFENDRLTQTEKSEGRGLKEQPLTIPSPDQATIGGQIFWRQSTTHSAK